YPALLFQNTPPHDPGRFWLLGFQPPGVVADVLAASTLHLYPSRAYPVARSLLEALASGCTVLAWDTAPVREVICHETTGLLVGPDEETPLDAARAVLDDPARFRPLGQGGADFIRREYAQDVTLPRLAEWFTELALGNR